MSIKIKKAKFVVPFLFLALSQLAFAGGYEQEQMKSVEQTFFDCSHQVKQDTTVEVQTSQYERFRLKISETAQALEAKATDEAHKMAAALRSLEKEMSQGGATMQADWGKFSLTVSAKLSGVSENMKHFGIKFKAKMQSIGVTVETDAVAFGHAVKNAAHLAAVSVELDIAATEHRMSEWGAWIHAKLLSAKTSTVADWNAFAKEIAVESHKFGGECEQFGTKIHGAIQTGSLDSKMFFQSLASHLENVGCKTYQGIETGFAQLHEDVKMDWEKTVHFFVGHVESQAVACEPQQQQQQQVVHHHEEQQQQQQVVHHHEEQQQQQQVVHHHEEQQQQQDGSQQAAR